MREEATRCELPVGSRELPHGRTVGKDLHGLQQTFPFLRGNQHAGGATVTRDLNRFTPLLRTPEELEQSVFRLGRRHRRHDGYYNGYFPPRNISRDRTGQ